MLQSHNKLRYFRNYSVFTLNKPKDEEKEVEIAYFTYLNREHENFFTKSPWDQYCTYNEIYIAHLKKDFNDLWKMSQPITEWVGCDNDDTSNLSLSIKLDSIQKEWETEHSSQPPQEQSK